MSIYPEKRQGKATGRLRIEVQRNKKTLVKFATSQKDARRLEMEMKAGVHDNPEVSSAAQSHTTSGLKLLEDQVERLWEGTKAAKKQTDKAYRLLHSLSKVLKDQGLADDLKVLKSAHLYKAVELSTTGTSASTYNGYLSVLSKLLGWAVDEEHIDAIPKLRFKEERRKETFILSHDDEAKERAELKKRGYDDIITVMDVQLATGCRISEVLERTPKDLIDDEDGFYSLYLGVTKNGQERYAVLETDLGKRFKELLDRGTPNYWMVYRRLKACRKAAGLPLTQPTHAHRHTVATRLASDNVNALLLKDFMGHENLQTTMRYVHADTDAKKQVAKRLRRPTTAANIGTSE